MKVEIKNAKIAAIPATEPNNTLRFLSELRFAAIKKTALATIVAAVGHHSNPFFCKSNTVSYYMVR